MYTRGPTKPCCLAGPKAPLPCATSDVSWPSRTGMCVDRFQLPGPLQDGQQCLILTSSRQNPGHVQDNRQVGAGVTSQSLAGP